MPGRLMVTAVWNSISLHAAVCKMVRNALAELYCMQVLPAGNPAEKTILHTAACNDILFQNCGYHKAPGHYRPYIYNRTPAA